MYEKNQIHLIAKNIGSKVFKIQFVYFFMVKLCQYIKITA